MNLRDVIVIGHDGIPRGRSDRYLVTGAGCKQAEVAAKGARWSARICSCCLAEPGVTPGSVHRLAAAMRGARVSTIVRSVPRHRVTALVLGEVSPLDLGVV